MGKILHRLSAEAIFDRATFATCSHAPRDASRVTRVLAREFAGSPAVLVCCELSADRLLSSSLTRDKSYLPLMSKTQSNATDLALASGQVRLITLSEDSLESVPQC